VTIAPSKAFELLRKLGGYSAVVYVTGFLAVRSELNSMGVPSDVAADLVDHSYFAKGGLVLLVALIFAAPSLLLVALLGYLADKLRARYARWPVVCNVGRALFTGIALASVLAGAWVLLGPLRVQGQLLRSSSSPLAPQGGMSTYAGCVMLAAIGGALIWTAVRKPELFVRHTFLVGAGTAVTMFSVLLLPMSYGALTAMDQCFPVAAVERKASDGETDAPEALAFLLISTQKKVVSYRDRVIRIDAGDDIKTVRVQCYGRLDKEPNCENWESTCAVDEPGPGTRLSLHRDDSHP
jgi:hypothetical protein